jgi:hypothetical protein
MIASVAIAVVPDSERQATQMRPERRDHKKEPAFAGDFAQLLLLEPNGR